MARVDVADFFQVDAHGVFDLALPVHLCVLAPHFRLVLRTGLLVPLFRHV